MTSGVIPVGLTSQEYLDLQMRLEEVENDLRTKFCADDQFCSQYFGAQVGCCSLISGICRKHVPNPPQLPPGFMCANEYGIRLSHNKTAMNEKRVAKTACKRALDSLLQEEKTHLNQKGDSSEIPESSGEMQSCVEPVPAGKTVADQVTSCAIPQRDWHLCMTRFYHREASRGGD